MWGITFESFVFERFLYDKLASKLDASLVHKILECVSLAVLHNIKSHQHLTQSQTGNLDAASVYKVAFILN